MRFSAWKEGNLYRRNYRTLAGGIVTTLTNRDDRGAASCFRGRGLRRWELSLVVKMES